MRPCARATRLRRAGQKQGVGIKGGPVSSVLAGQGEIAARGTGVEESGNGLRDMKRSGGLRRQRVLHPDQQVCWEPAGQKVGCGVCDFCIPVRSWGEALGMGLKGRGDRGD